jgi:flagellar protein FlaF
MVQANAAAAYASVHKQTVSGRDLESQVLTKCAMKIKDCVDNWDKPETSAKMSDALRNNHKVWLLFQSEVSNAQCQLPNDIKINIIRLANFVGKQTLGIMAAPAKEKLPILIDINLHIAAGLQGR